MVLTYSVGPSFVVIRKPKKAMRRLVGFNWEVAAKLSVFTEYFFGLTVWQALVAQLV